MTVFDLSNCDREPIHIPGKIQEHGFLVAITHDLTISYCSENIAVFAPITAGTMLSSSVYFLETVILKKTEGFIEKLIAIGQSKDGFDAVNPYAVDIEGREFNLIICASNDLYLL
ncbi:MAG: histidine kinase, partial [Bacteroidota bacterium]|nr:histidine kinase [Bacteroidota bacterium]